MTADDGVPIYYTDRGEGDPIFLIHGWTMNHKFFQHNIPELSRTHRVVTMGIRGHGHSGKQELNMSLRQAAKDARAVIEHLSLERVTIAGWSMGTSLIFHQVELRENRVDLSNIRCAVLNVSGKWDFTVPPSQTEATTALASSSDKESVSLEAGHVGMLVGPAAVGSLWPRLRDWLTPRSG